MNKESLNGRNVELKYDLGFTQFTHEMYIMSINLYAITSEYVLENIETTWLAEEQNYFYGRNPEIISHSGNSNYSSSGSELSGDKDDSEISGVSAPGSGILSQTPRRLPTIVKKNLMDGTHFNLSYKDTCEFKYNNFLWIEYKEGRENECNRLFYYPETHKFKTFFQNINETTVGVIIIYPNCSAEENSVEIQEKFYDDQIIIEESMGYFSFLARKNFTYQFNLNLHHKFSGYINSNPEFLHRDAVFKPLDYNTIEISLLHEHALIKIQNQLNGNTTELEVNESSKTYQVKLNETGRNAYTIQVTYPEFDVEPKGNILNVVYGKMNSYASNPDNFIRKGSYSIRFVSDSHWIIIIL